MAELYWRSLMTLLYSEWHLFPRWPLRSIFARFPEQLLKDLVSWGSSGECSMIDRFLGDAFWVLSYQFWSTVLQSGARLPIHTLKTGPCSQWCPVSNWVCAARFLTGCARFLTGCVLTVAYATVSNSGVCFIRSGVKRCTLLMVLYLDRMCHAVWVTRGALVTHRYTYAPPRCRTSQYSRTFIPFSVSL